MSTVAITPQQFERIRFFQNAVKQAEGQRDLILGVILDGSPFAGQNLNITHVDEKGIHFEILPGGDPASAVPEIPTGPKLVSEAPTIIGEGEE